MLGWGHGHGVIMNKHYRIVKSVEPGSYQASSDMHEFRVLPDGKSALMTQYLRATHDLCDYGICHGLGYVNQGAFQEVDIDTGKVIFEWRSLDHIDLSESYVLPSSTEVSGSGLEPASPWDYFHINSVDKNADGDYLISARHVSALYKISGKDGHVIWRLSGAKSDFRLIDFLFTFQHDARFVSETEDETVISIFDNGTNGFNQTQPWSTALLIRLNHRDCTAHLLRVYDPPILEGSRHIAKSQGNFQRLLGGNFVLGWGCDAFWSEHLEDGTTVFYGSIGYRNVMNYRVHKFDNWVGLPLTKPALWTYARNGNKENGSMMVYVSWNGATEVKEWVFYTSDSKSGPWSRAVTIPKSGFETIHRLESFSRYTYAEAVDKDATSIGISAIQETFVPSEGLKSYCDDLACKFAPDDEETRQQIKEAGQRQRIAEELQRNAAARRKKIFASVFGGIGGLVAVIAAVISIRRFVHEPAARLRHKIIDAFAGQSRGRYKAVMSPLPTDETEESTQPLSWTSGRPPSVR